MDLGSTIFPSLGGKYGTGESHSGDDTGSFRPPVTRWVDELPVASHCIQNKSLNLYHGLQGLCGLHRGTRSNPWSYSPRCHTHSLVSSHRGLLVAPTTFLPVPGLTVPFALDTYLSVFTLLPPSLHSSSAQMCHQNHWSIPWPPYPEQHPPSAIYLLEVGTNRASKGDRQLGMEGRDIEIHKYRNTYLKIHIYLFIICRHHWNIGEVP